MKKFILLLTILAVGKLYPQDLKLSYILPDIGAPGMNTYVEFFAPVDSLNEFGDDNFYLNNFDSPVRIEYVNPDDSNKVVFGPIVVSWDGRLISSQAFVHPFIDPGTSDWTAVSPEFKIPIRINFNGRVSNIDTFYIVQEYQLGDISSMPESVFGEGNLGKRSRRGAMIVDSLLLGDKRYTVSTNDCDPNTPGNQGFLPFVLMSRGGIRGAGPSSEIDVGADGRHGGPGGGGGGGKFCDDVFGSRTGSVGGDGYTGGGRGGWNDNFGGGSYKNAGTGTGGTGQRIVDYIPSGYMGDHYYAGFSLNGVPGGATPATTWESAGGGTGHPFGKSGLGCVVGDFCSPDGGFGGGSGYQHNLEGGNAGYGTDGLQRHSANYYGKANGNIMNVPLAGGSGGAGGNPQGQGQCSGEGGGGGGAMTIFARSMDQIDITSMGANGVNDDGNGGNGSGGGISIMSKLTANNMDIDVRGGTDEEGGAGRIRKDALGLSSINQVPSDASDYRGLTTDSLLYTTKDRNGLEFNGTQPESSRGQLFIRPENGIWRRLTDVFTSNDTRWTISDLNLPGKDSIYYIVHTVNVDNPSSAQYLTEPERVMSQAAATIFYVPKEPIINGDSTLVMSVLDCRFKSVSDSIRLWNEGTDTLRIDFDNHTFTGDNTFSITSPSGIVKVDPGDTIWVHIRYDHDMTNTDPATSTLTIPHNAEKMKKPWTVDITVNIMDYGFQVYTKDFSRELGYLPGEELDMGEVCLGDDKLDSIAIVSRAAVPLFMIERLAVNDTFELTFLTNPVPEYDTTYAEVYFTGNVSAVGPYSRTFMFGTDDPCGLTDTIVAFIDVVDADLSIEGNTNFGNVLVGDSKELTVYLKNNGTADAYIETLPFGSPPFEIISTNPPIPPPQLIPPGGSIEIIVRFSPTMDVTNTWQTYFGSILQDGACPDTVQARFTGRGIISRALVEPDSIHFGTFMECMNSDEDSVMIINIGTADLTIESADITGADAASFEITQRPAAEPFVINPDDTVYYYVRYLGGPGAAGFKQAAFVLETDDAGMPVWEVQLTAIKEDLMLAAIPDTIDFGDVPIGWPQQSDFSIDNGGSFDQNISDIVESHGDFNVPLDASNDIITAGGSADYTVFFTPTREGPVFDSLVFQIDDPCPNEYVVYVKANGLLGDAEITDAIDFGILAPCETASDEVRIDNTGDAPIIIDTMYIRGADAGDFSFSGQVAFPLTLASGSFLSREILFDPSAPDAVKNAECVTEIEINGIKADSITSLTGERQTGLLSYPSPVDFGNVTVTVTANETLTLENNGVHTITLNSMTNVNPPFTVTPSSVNGVILQPDESITFDLTFTPDQLIEYRDSIVFDFDVSTCPESAKIDILGRGAPSSTISIWLPDTTVQPDIDNFRLPVYAKNLTANNPVDSVNIEAMFTFDASLIHVDGITDGTLLENRIEGRTQTVRFKLEKIPVSEDGEIITEILGATLLGSAETTSLAWKQDSIFVSPVTEVSHFEALDGSLTTEICEAGGQRLLAYGNELSLQILPNPAGEAFTAKITALERGRHILEMVDLNGRTKVLAEWNVPLNGDKKYEFDFSSGDFSGGMYYLRLRSPMRMKIEPLFIIK